MVYFLRASSSFDSENFHALSSLGKNVIWRKRLQCHMVNTLELLCHNSFREMRPKDKPIKVFIFLPRLRLCRGIYRGKDFSIKFLSLSGERSRKFPFCSSLRNLQFDFPFLVLNLKDYAELDVADPPSSDGKSMRLTGARFKASDWL